MTCHRFLGSPAAPSSTKVLGAFATTIDFQCFGWMIWWRKDKLHLIFDWEDENRRIWFKKLMIPYGSNPYRSPKLAIKNRIAGVWAFTSGCDRPKSWELAAEHGKKGRRCWYLSWKFFRCLFFNCLIGNDYDFCNVVCLVFANTTQRQAWQVGQQIIPGGHHVFCWDTPTVHRRRQRCNSDFNLVADSWNRLCFDRRWIQTKFTEERASTCLHFAKISCIVMKKNHDVSPNRKNVISN